MPFSFTNSLPPLLASFSVVIPYWTFLVVYLVLVAILLFFGLASVYHLLRYGFMSGMAVLMAGVLAAGTVFILILSYQTLAGVDWQQQLTFGQLVNSVNPF